MNDKKVPADAVQVNSAEAINIARFIVNEDMHQNPAVLPAGDGTERMVRAMLQVYNENLKSRGYEGDSVNVEAILTTPNGGASFLVGDKNFIVLSEETLNASKEDIYRQVAHEFGHLYNRHGTNYLSDLHPEINSGNTPQVANLQKQYAHLFAQIDVEYERKQQQEKQIDTRTAEFEAETMAIKQVCLPEVSQNAVARALDQAKAAGVELSQETLGGLMGIAEAARPFANDLSLLPTSCVQVRGKIGKDR